jgi:hypothetical protein
MRSKRDPRTERKLAPHHVKASARRTFRMLSPMRSASALLLGSVLFACASGADARPGARDAGGFDGGLVDATAVSDGAGLDGAELDGASGDGSVPVDGSPVDGSADIDSGTPIDSGAGVPDAGVDAGLDSGVDAGPVDRCAGVDCSAMVTACRTAACDPTSGTCVSTPRPDGTSCGADRACALPRCSAGSCVDQPRVGATCDDGNACTVGDSCSAAGTCTAGGPATTCGDASCLCGETAASCPADCASTGVPPNACTTSTSNRDRCSNARIIGRRDARTGWSSGVQNTCSASDRHDDACASFDVGPDHTYAIYVRAGERVTATLGTTTTRCASGEEYRSYLKMKFHASTDASGATSCPDFVGCWAGPRRFDDFTYMRTYDATTDGWLFVIVDGGASAFDEHRGYYSLDVGLSRCATAACDC